MTNDQHRRSRALQRFALCAILATPAMTQGFTPQELSRAGHVLRRMQHGAGLNDYGSVLPSGTTSQLTNIFNYILARTTATPLPIGTEATSLLGLYPGIPIPVGASNPSHPSFVPQASAAWSIEELAEVNIVRAVWSEDTLREVMTRFWQEHFTTNFHALNHHFFMRFLGPPYNMAPGAAATAAAKYASYFEWQQNDRFRLNAMGRFSDLLLASGQGTAMMIYLDTVGSGFPEANQNYARELLELHTLGRTSPVPGPMGAIYFANYTFDDIIAASKAFSGWTIVDNGTVAAPNFVFSFTPATCPQGNLQHITTCPFPGPSRVFFNNPAVTPFVGVLTVPEDQNTPSEGLALLNHLANSPATAYFVSKKLYKLFISEVEPQPFDQLLLDCVTAWLSQPGGNIQGVLHVLLSSDRFLNDITIRWNLERQPIEAVAQTVDLFHGRAFEPTATVAENKARVARLRTLIEGHGGQELFRYGPPDGFPRGDSELLTTNRMLGSTRLRQELYSLFGPFTASYPSVFFDYFAVLGSAVNWLDETSIRSWFSLISFNNDQSSGDDLAMQWFLASDLNGNPGPTLAQDFFTNIALFIQRATTGFAFIAAHSLNNLK